MERHAGKWLGSRLEWGGFTSAFIQIRRCGVTPLVIKCQWTSWRHFFVVVFVWFFFRKSVKVYSLSAQHYFFEAWLHFLELIQIRMLSGRQIALSNYKNADVYFWEHVYAISLRSHESVVVLFWTLYSVYRFSSAFQFALVIIPVLLALAFLGSFPLCVPYSWRPAAFIVSIRR